MLVCMAISKRPGEPGFEVFKDDRGGCRVRSVFWMWVENSDILGNQLGILVQVHRAPVR